MEHGPDEARRAFNEDERWKHGPTYVFVDGIAKSGEQSIAHVFPPDPSREGTAWGTSVDSFGNDLFYELHRTLSIVDSGWIYNSFRNPETGGEEPKSSYVIEVDWDGQRAAVGAGIYAPDLPGTCNADEVNAAGLAAAPSAEKLQALVRCAAMLVEEKGYSARHELEGSSRWRQGSSYVFVMDMAGNQVLTGNPVRVNGKALHEWGGKSNPMDQFGGRDMIAVGDAFGEALIYYRGFNPMSGSSHPKVGLLKRVVAHGVPVIVGAGYALDSEPAVSEPSCKDNHVSARGIRTRRDVQAFVRCAAEYVAEHGTEEARRAFHEDARWRHGPYYVFVDLLAQPSEGPLSHIAVFPPNPSWEGTSQTLVDNFGTDYFHELHRVMTFVDSGWLHYAFTNFVTGRSEPKSTYVVEIDWGGRRAVVGTGIYLRDLPGTCVSAEVNAAGLEADPSAGRLQELVRCAAAELESQGYFATVNLASHPRWKSESVYVFGLDRHGGSLFSGAPQSVRSGTGASELSPASDEPFGGRDMVSAGVAFGEAFFYYSTRNPSTGMPGRKVAFVKRVVIQGLPVLVGAGYYPDQVGQVERLKNAVVAALDTLVADFVADRPADAATYAERLRAYLEAHPAFFGSAAALLDRDGTVTSSPYVYRTEQGYATTDLAVPTYNIERQTWFTAPLATNGGIWTTPYFDAGGGEIWMITRSVPARDAEGIFAIITTDLPVDAPSR